MVKHKFLFIFISNVDSLDWKDYGADAIIRTVTKHKNLTNGAIILMHKRREVHGGGT